MVHKSTISVREVIVESLYLFKKTWLSFVFFAVLNVSVTYVPSVYTLLLKSFLADNPLLYIIGMALLVVLFIVYIYYSVRLTMNCVQKLKALLEGRTFNFLEEFSNNENRFWRALAVLIIKSLVLSLSMIASVLLFIYLKYMYIDQASVRLAILLPLLVSVLLGWYISYRLEFSLVTVYWNLNIKSSDFKSSFMITKHQKIKKIMIILVAQVPVGLISLIQFVNTYDIDEPLGALYATWTALLATLLVNGAIYSWPYIVYYVMLSKMGYTASYEKVVHDEEGREWISY